MSGRIAEKLATLSWFAKRPPFYQHMVVLIGRALTDASRHERAAPDAAAWAAGRTVPRDIALAAVGLSAAKNGVSQALLDEAAERARRSAVGMGGPGDLDLLYSAILASGATRVVETGVAYGWSSLAALAALEQTGGRLASVDMPYPKAGNDRFVGIVVPERMRERWTLIRKPDRNGVKQAIAHFGGTIDLCHFDSDKSYGGRMYAYPLLWRALRPGGIFISDDIEDNFGFRDYFHSLGVPFAVVHCGGRYVGIAAKLDQAT